MEKIIQQNQDEMKLKYIIVTLFSWLTLSKIKKVEDLRKELKEQFERENDMYKL